MATRTVRGAAPKARIERPAALALPGKRGPRSKGLTKAMFSVEPAQIEALRREASRRASQDPEVRAGRRSLRAAVDASALVREALGDWLAKNAK